MEIAFNLLIQCTTYFTCEPENIVICIQMISLPSGDVKATNKGCTGIYEFNSFDKVMDDKTLFSGKSCSI